MLLATPGLHLPATQLRAAGIDIAVAGRATVRSAAPLGFIPTVTTGYPLLISGDLAGLDSVPGLSGVYRSQTWLSPLATAHLQSWQLAGVERRLQQAQAALLQRGSQFALSAPFAALDRARSAADAAPRHLLAAGGGALAALGMFVILAAYGLRRDQRPEVDRLRGAGARTGQRLLFSLGEAAALSGLALAAGLVLGIVVAAVLAHRAGLPTVGVLDHSLLSGRGLAILGLGWLIATAVVGLVLTLPGGRAADALALAAVAALALALARGGATDGLLSLLLAPLTCLAGGVLVYRAAEMLLRGCEGLSRHGPLPVRLALVSLARAPVGPSLAIAFIAVSTGLAGFALAYRATLLRGTTDQAANRVPLDLTVAAGPDFITPTVVAPAARWRALTGGTVLPVRRSYAAFTNGAAGVTVPVLGVPADGLRLLHGWRASDGSLPSLAPRLRPLGPVRMSGPNLPARVRTLSLALSASAAPVEVKADLRSPDGVLTQLAVGTAAASRRTATVHLPPGPHELQALELDEPSGERATAGHQMAENPAAPAQGITGLTLGSAVLRDRAGKILRRVSLRRWVGVGAANGQVGAGLRFTNSGVAGLVRPVQPSDHRPVPVLADRSTAAAASSGGLLALSVDGLPITGRIVGALRRFPTLTAAAGGFVIADEATLAAALDASLPGQGRPDELWIDTVHRDRVGAALARPPLNRLTASWRADAQHALRSEPVAVGTLGTLAAAAALAAVLAVVGLLAALVGSLRDPRIQRDLMVQGLGPRALSGELRLRFLIAGGVGVMAGLALTALLTPLAVAAVRAGAALQSPRPALVAVLPWGQLLLGALVLMCVFALVGWASAPIAVRASEGSL
jgi:hypothetical protein